MCKGAASWSFIAGFVTPNKLKSDVDMNELFFDPRRARLVLTWHRLGNNGETSLIDSVISNQGAPGPGDSFLRARG